jgi:hypothetical protein
MTDTATTTRIIDYMDIAVAPSGGCRTQLWEANMVKGGSILPYYQEGRIIWMWKDPDQWLVPDVVSQFENLIVVPGHPGHDYSHYNVVGMARDARIGDSYIQGNIAMFHPDALNEVAAGVTQLSPDAMVRLRPIGREINGQWVDFAQDSPVLDHLGLVRDGRGGADVAIKRIADDSDALRSICFELDPAKLRTTVEFISTDQNGTQMKTVEELQAALDTANGQLGSQAATIVQITDERDQLKITVEAQTAQLATFQAQDSTAAVAEAAQSALTLLDSAREFGIVVTIADCLSNPVGVYRQIQGTLTDNSSLQISDEALPMFCAGLIQMKRETRLAAQAAGTTGAAGAAAATGTVQHVSDSAANHATNVVVHARNSNTAAAAAPAVPAGTNPLAPLGQSDRIFVQ